MKLINYQSFRTDFDSEVGVWLKSAINRGFGEDPIMIRMSGGSIPISPFVNTLGIPAVRCRRLIGTITNTVPMKT